MKTHFFSIALLILFGLNITGCSSLQSNNNADKAFSAFLSQTQHYALFTPATLESEEKLRVLGVSDYGQRISQQYGVKIPIVKVIELFLQSTPILSQTTIVQPKKANALSLPPDYSVLFFHSDWNFIYRRIPPSFSMNKLQVGIIGKIIPFGQVISGHGPTALKTAAWEGKCFYEAFEGKYISQDEWEADNGKLVHQGILEAQNYCAEKFIYEFSNQLKSHTLVPTAD